MKGEYLEDQEKKHNYISQHQIFPKFPSPQNLHFPFAGKDSGDADHSPSSSKKPPADDGSTVELPRRPRGRPPGSKNRPRPPVIITHEPEPAMSPYILELPTGSDIVDSLTRFTRRRGISICVLTASGSVANVTLKQPAPAVPGATVTFHGRFDVLSLSAVLLLQTAPFDDFGGLTISFAGPQGQIVGGMVVGPLISAGTVYVVATSFNSPSFHRLPLDDNEGEIPASGAGDERSGSPVSGGSIGGGGGRQTGMYNSSNMNMGSGSSDVMWASTVRPPFPPHY